MHVFMHFFLELILVITHFDHANQLGDLLDQLFFWNYVFMFVWWQQPDPRQPLNNV
uniref:Uncharacterized protein n=1 Tax=Oryza brachyantha TaxID=4533 RepID=J3NBK0_ORYBR